MMDKNFKPIVEAAQAGGEVLKKYFGKKLDVMNEKYNAADLQTTADLEAEKVIIEILNKNFPGYNILSEEAGEIDRKSKYSFVIDPLDGTNNFVLGIANFTNVIALTEDGTTIFSVVHSPMTNETFYAQQGNGAFLNKKKIKVNSESDITRATIAHHVDYSCNLLEVLDFRKRLADKKVKRILSNWSPAFELCLLASGRIEGIIRENGVIHDFLAGKMITKEAGAKVTDFEGGPDKEEQSDRFIISNGTDVHRHLLDVVTNKYF